MNGLLYIADGKFVEEAKISARTARTHMPDIPITLVTDRQVNGPFDSVLVEEMRGDFGDHIYHIDKAPYDKVIKCDSDLYFDDSVRGVFTLLDRFDIALARAPLEHGSDDVDIPGLEGIPESFPEYQGGVIGFRNSEIFNEFVDLWKQSYKNVLECGEVHNQAALRVALYDSDLRIATLPRRYNCLYRMSGGTVNNKVKIFHGRLMDLDRGGAPKRADITDAVETINSRRGLRSYYRSGRSVKLVKPNLFAEAFDSTRRNGVPHVIRRGIEIVSNKI